MEYNGWKNKETWLVNVWYMDHAVEYFAEFGDHQVEPEDLEEVVEYIAEEGEALSQLPVGLLSDFIRTCWSEVDWHNLAEHLNANLNGKD